MGYMSDQYYHNNEIIFLVKTIRLNDIQLNQRDFAINHFFVLFEKKYFKFCINQLNLLFLLQHFL